MENDITLIPLTKEHIEMVRIWRNSEEVSKYMYSSPNITKEQQESWFEKVSKDPAEKYFIINYNGKDLGLASLYNINYNFKRCYWAFYLGDTSIRGQGIGSKVEFNMLNLVFNELKMNKLLCEVFVSNDKVIKMHEKFGFRRESYFREHIYKDGQFHDVVGLAMLKAEWEEVINFHKLNIYSHAD